VIAKSKRLLSILKKAPPCELDETLRSSGDSASHENVIAVQQDYAKDERSSSSRRAQLFSLMGLQQPSPPLLSCDMSTQQDHHRSEQDREKPLLPATQSAIELLTDSQVARKRSVTRVADEKQDKLQSLLFGKLKTGNNHADINPDRSSAASRVVKLISPSDLKAIGYR